MEKPHKKLDVWKKSIEYAKEIYKITDKYPQSENFGLSLQMRRAVVSISSNIAEGSARQTGKEKVQFYYIAMGSVSELDTQIEISKEIGFISLEEKEKLLQGLDFIGRLLTGLIKSRKIINNNVA